MKDPGFLNWGIRSFFTILLLSLGRQFRPEINDEDFSVGTGGPLTPRQADAVDGKQLLSTLCLADAEEWTHCVIPQRHSRVGRKFTGPPLTGAASRKGRPGPSPAERLRHRALCALPATATTLA
jgi:hypothetical protein